MYKDTTNMETNQAKIVEFILDTFFIRKDCYGRYIEHPGKKASGVTCKNAVTKEKITAHIAGKTVIGAYTTNTQQKAKWGCFDLDCSDVAKQTFIAGEKDLLIQEQKQLLPIAINLYRKLLADGYKPIMENSIGGFHVWLFFDKPVSAKNLFHFLQAIIKNMRIDCETFPKQESIQKNGFGNFVRLPGRWHSRPDHHSAIWTGKEWLSFQQETAWLYLIEQQKNGIEQIENFPIPEPQPKKTLPTSKPTKDRKTSTLNELQQASFNNWIDEQLKEFGVTGIVSLLEEHFGTLRQLHTNPDGKAIFCCPFHEDKSPSAWCASNGNNVPMLHCSGNSCQVKNHAMQGLQVAMACGRNFLQSCMAIAGYYPNFCQCGKEIFIDNTKRRYNDRNNQQIHATTCPIAQKTHETHKSKIEQKLYPPATEETQTIEASFAGWDGQIMIVAEPGSGKTTGAIVKEADAIANNIQFAYIANNRTDLDDFHKKALAQNPKAKILKLQGGSSEIEGDLLVDEENQREGINKYQFINTHSTFAKRKGLGRNFYNFLNWIKQNKPFVVIDEINEFIGSLETMTPLRLMSTTARRPGTKEPYTTVYHECPSFSAHAYKCHLCQECNNLQPDVNVYGVADLTLFSGKQSHIQSNIFCFEEDLRDWPIIDIPEANFSVTKLSQKSGYLENKAKSQEKLPIRYDTDEIFGRDEIDDIINCSLFPSLVEIYPTFNNIRYHHDDRYSDEIKAKVKFPSRSCGKYLVLCDLLPLKIIAQYSLGVRMLCTDISQHSLDILQHVFPNLQVKRAKRKVDKLANVLLLGFARELRPQTIAVKAHDIEPQKTLHFEPSDRQANKAFAKSDNNNAIGKVVGGIEIEPKRKFVTDELFHIIANSHGSLGKAVNLTEYAACIVNTALYKPFIAYPHSTDKDAIIQQIWQYRIELICQNLGRILRENLLKPIPYRICLIHGISKIEFDMVANTLNLAKITGSPQIKYLEQDEPLVWETMLEYLKTGNVIERSETQKAIKVSSLSKKQRELTKEEREKTSEQKEKTKLNEKLEQARKMKAEGKTRKEAYISLNMRRCPEIQKEFNEIFNTQ